MISERTASVLRFAGHFVLGALVGSLLGYSLWCFVLAAVPLWILMVVCASVLGLVAGIWGADFWDFCREHHLWRLWP